MLKSPRKRAFGHFAIGRRNATPGKRPVFRRGQQRPGTLKVCYHFRYHRQPSRRLSGQPNLGSAHPPLGSLWGYNHFGPNNCGELFPCVVLKIAATTLLRLAATIANTITQGF